MVITAPHVFSEQLGPDDAAGSLTGLSQDILVDSGLVTESNSMTDADFLTLKIDNAPNATYDIAASLTLAIEGHEVEMPMTIHRVPGPNPVYADPLVGKRVTVYQ